MEGVKCGGGWTRVDIAEVTCGLAKIDGLGGLGLKNGGAFSAAGLLRWMAHGVIAKQSREGGVSVQCPYKKLDHFAPAWVVILEI